MPKAVNTFINELALKAGLKPDDKTLVDLLSATELQNVQVPDELISSIDSNLISVEQAKNNHPEIKPHYTSMALTGVDAEVDRLLDEYGLPDNLKLVVNNERNTYKRLPLAFKKLEEAKAAKAATTDKTEKQSLQMEIDRLNTEIRTYKDAVETTKKEYATKEANMRKDVLIDEMLDGYKTIFDDTLSREAKRPALRALVERKLQEKGAELVLDETGKRLKLVGQGGANVFGEDNLPWDAQTLFDKTFSQNKVLKVTDQPPKDNTKPADNRNIIAGDDKDTAPKRNSTLSSLVKRSLNDADEADKYSNQMIKGLA